MIAGSDRELKMLDKASAEFARKELAPARQDNDAYPFAPFFDGVLKKAYDLDFFHIVLPETCSGVGQGITALCVILYNICREDSSLGGIVFTNAACQEMLLAAGAENLLTAITKTPETAADCLIAAPIFNNPVDIANTADAVMKNGDYLLSGCVEYVVIGNIARHALIPAKIEGSADFSFFLVDLSGKGVSISEPVHSLGLHACPAVDITMNSAPGTPLGDTGEGRICFEKMSDRMSAAAAAMSAGIMAGAFKEALEYSRGRFQGGREIVNWSEVRMLLAEMAVKVKTAEAMLASVCRAVDTNEAGWQDYARASAIEIQRNACDLTTDGIQILGGVGYMKDFGQEKRFRDAKHIQALLGMVPMKKLRLIKRLI
ncbi:MAG: acyl-CoA dehydrogenase family protein [Desulfobacterales bacterium]